MGMMPLFANAYFVLRNMISQLRYVKLRYRDLMRIEEQREKAAIHAVIAP